MLKESDRQYIQKETPGVTSPKKIVREKSSNDHAHDLADENPYHEIVFQESEEEKGELIFPESNQESQNQPNHSSPQKRINGRKDLVKLYLDEAGKIPLLTPDEENEIAKRSNNGDLRSRRDFINSNLRFVVYKAKTYQNRGLPLIDLIQAGNIGLINAVDRNDPGRGFRLTDYAGIWIKKEIVQAIIDQSSTIRVPKDVYNLIIKMSRVEKKNHRKIDLSDEEVGKKLNVSPEDIGAAREANMVKDPLPLDIEGEDGEEAWLRHIPDPNSNTALKEFVISRDLDLILEKYLTPDEEEFVRKVLEFDFEHKELARELGEEWNSVRNRYTRILRRLRDAAEKDNL